MCEKINKSDKESFTEIVGKQENAVNQHFSFPIPYKHFFLQGLYFCFICDQVQQRRITMPENLSQISMPFVMIGVVVTYWVLYKRETLYP